MKKIKSLRKQGFKNKEISQELNIAPKTLERYNYYEKEWTFISPFFC